MTQLALEIRDLRVELGSRRGQIHAVNGVSFSVEKGMIHGIVGESGCGKTTLLRSILGLLPHNARVSTGNVFVNGTQVLGPEIVRRREAAEGVSIVFQEPMTALNPVMKIGEQIAEAPRLLEGLGSTGAQERAIDLMRQVGIPDPERRYGSYPHELSGGLRQRVLVAIALSSRPTVMLCDEPTTALDVTIQDQILRLLGSIADETGVTIVYVTHDLAVVAQICETLSVMYAGRFVESGPVSEVFQSPRHPYTASLLRAVPDMTRDRTSLVAIPGAPPDLVRLETGCVFAPRCQYAIEECKRGSIDLTEMSDGRATACIRYEEIALETFKGAS